MTTDIGGSNAATPAPSEFGHEVRARSVTVSTMERNVRPTFASGLVALVLPMVLILPHQTIKSVSAGRAI